LNGSIFLSAEIDTTSISISNCSPIYYVFESTAPYYPIQGAKAEAICVLNDDNTTASWNITKSCEPSCSIRGCDNNQICGKPIGETLDRCICYGFFGKYCEYIDPEGFS